MASTENKTQPTSQDITTFLNAITDEQQRRDSERLVRIMSEATGQPATMWGSSMIGFGQYHYKYDSGREGDYLATGFSPRKGNITVYLMDGFDTYTELMAQLGPYKTGKSCLYLKSLDAVNEEVLRKLIAESYARVMETMHKP